MHEQGWETRLGTLKVSGLYHKKVKFPLKISDRAWWLEVLVLKHPGHHVGKVTVLKTWRLITQEQFNQACRLRPVKPRLLTEVDLEQLNHRQALICVLLRCSKNTVCAGLCVFADAVPEFHLKTTKHVSNFRFTLVDSETESWNL